MNRRDFLSLLLAVPAIEKFVGPFRLEDRLKLGNGSVQQSKCITIQQMCALNEDDSCRKATLHFHQMQEAGNMNVAAVRFVTPTFYGVIDDALVMDDLNGEYLFHAGSSCSTGTVFEQSQICLVEKIKAGMNKVEIVFPRDVLCSQTAIWEISGAKGMDL